MVVPSIPLAPWEIAVVAGASLLICVISTSMAMESTALFVPAIVLLFPAVLPRFPAVGVNGAIGLALIVMFFGQTSANVGYWLRGQIDVPVALAALVWTIPLAILGRISSYAVPETLLLLVFSALLIGLSGIVYRHAADSSPSSSPAVPEDASGNDRADSRVRLRIRDRLAMSAGGGVTGLVGLGMGEVCNTILTARNGMAVHPAIGTSTLVLYLTVLSAAVTNLGLVSLGDAIGVEPSIPWGIAAIIAPVVLVGGQIGPYLNATLPERAVVRVLLVLYPAVAIVTAVRALG